MHAALRVVVSVLWRRVCRGAPALALAGFVVVALGGPATAATKIVVVESPGGVSAWLVREPSIPIVTLEIAFRGGAALDPADKEGLAYMVSGLLDEGAGPYDSLAFQQRLKRLAVSLDFDSGRDTFHVTLKTLTRHREEAFRLLGLALGRPRFDAEAIERIRGQILNDLSRRAEDPDDIAVRTWFAKAFPDHPYGRSRQGTPVTIAAITAGDLQRFVRQRFARDNVVIAAVGDIAPAELGRLIDVVFSGLPRGAAPAEVSDTEIATPGSVTVVRKPNPQSVVMFGLRGVKRDDPDYYAAYLMTYILGGGGFTSRLYQEVREERGLAYSVYSYLNPFRHAGLLMGGVGTANERVADSLAIIRSEIARLGENGVSAEELADAKTFLNGSFPLRLTSSSGIAGTLVAMQLNELGIEYIERRKDHINAVSEADIRRIARRLLQPGQMIVVVVGDPVGIETGGEGG